MSLASLNVSWHMILREKKIQKKKKSNETANSLCNELPTPKSHLKVFKTTQNLICFRNESIEFGLIIIIFAALTVSALSLWQTGSTLWAITNDYCCNQLTGTFCSHLSCRDVVVVGHFQTTFNGHFHYCWPVNLTLNGIHCNRPAMEISCKWLQRPE